MSRWRSARRLYHLAHREGLRQAGRIGARVPANLLSAGADADAMQAPSIALGPRGPFPAAPLRRVLERRWLHYAFLSRDGSLGLVANVARLGAGPDDASGDRTTSILLLHERGRGWSTSQYNSRTLSPLWSSFRRPHPDGVQRRLGLSATGGGVSVDLGLQRTSRSCTSQCATFGPGQHLRWQSETGVVARGDWTIGERRHSGVEAVGYHERVRGTWGWPELGGWVFGFANDPATGAGGAPGCAVVFTLIQPLAPADATTGSLMVWRDGRLARHFPRRRVTVAVRGELDQAHVAQVPALARMLGTRPMTAIPRRLVVAAAMGRDHVVLDFCCESAARVVVPSETGLDPFTVHEAIGAVAVHGRIGRRALAFETVGIVEFAGGARGD
jgi:hypothetical protein